MNRSAQVSLTPIDEALPALLDAIRVIDEKLRLPLTEASGRVLREDVISAINVPLQANSAMDGIAVHSADVTDTPRQLPLTQRIAAGQIGAALAAGEAARIFTGAPLPQGADAVVIQENCEFSEETVTVLQPVAAGENVRPAGEDVRQGQLLFAAGHRLRPQDLGVLAASGVEQVSVTRTLTAAVMTTGDELVAPGTPLAPGQIYNANAVTLHALLTGLGVEVIDLGVVRDDPDSTTAALKEAADHADCIISTGGVSVGEEDHVKAAVQANGHLDLWKLAIKPGKPFASGRVNNTPFFGLPGNPVSTFVTFVLLVRPCLLAMQGCRDLLPLTMDLAAAFSQKESGERQQYLRVALRRDDAGQRRLHPYSNQSSGVSASLSGADGLAIIPPYTAVAKGDRLTFIPFSELLQ